MIILFCIFLFTYKRYPNIDLSLFLEYIYGIIIFIVAIFSATSIIMSFYLYFSLSPEDTTVDSITRKLGYGKSQT